MRIEPSRHGSLPPAPDRETVTMLAERLLGLHDPERPTGLYLASGNAGMAPAVRFWEDACRDGVAFASPEMFSWCLANAACGALARAFGIIGPNATFLGGAEALGAALDHAADDLEAGCTEAALVVAVDFGAGRRRTPYAAVRLSSAPDARWLENATGTRSLASTALARALR